MIGNLFFYSELKSAHIPAHPLIQILDDRYKISDMNRPITDDGWCDPAFFPGGGRFMRYLNGL
jgi:hypothetical protein